MFNYFGLFIICKLYGNVVVLVFGCFMFREVDIGVICWWVVCDDDVLYFFFLYGMFVDVFFDGVVCDEMIDGDLFCLIKMMSMIYGLWINGWVLVRVVEDDSISCG